MAKKIMEIDPRLRAAAQTGNIDALYTLIQEDPYMLEDIEKIPFVDTPLHIAAREGKIHFAREMMNLMASFARKLNRDGFSPMHLALINEQTELVLQMLETDKDLVRVKGKEGMTPLHYAATRGNSSLLVDIFEACPECIEDVTVRDETALHLALKNDHIEAFEVLIRWLVKNPRRGGFALQKKIANFRDTDGNTVLHIAAKKDDHQGLKLLLALGVPLALRIDAKTKNSEGLTAREIIQNVERKAMNSAEYDTTKIKLFKKERIGEPILVTGRRTKSLLSEDKDMLNATLVVTALVITAIYQSALSPPGGVWQPTDDSNTKLMLHFIPFNNNNHSIPHLFGEESRKAGTTIMDPSTYAIFWLLNTITFQIPVLLTCFLLSDLLQLLFPLYFLVTSYNLSMTILSPSTIWSYVNLVFTLIIILFPFLSSFQFYFIYFPLSINYKELNNLRRVVRKANNVQGIEQLT